MTDTTAPERTLAGGAIEELRTAIHGEVIAPGDAGYDDARTIWNACHDKHPAVIVRCSGVADVRIALEFGRSEGLEVAVRGGSHSIPGFSTCDGGIVIDLGPMKGVRVDPVARRVVAQGGCTWSELDHETQSFGLACTGGLVSSTGIAGFSLGGGVGHLLRKQGLAIDSLVAADVITADGSLVRAGEGGDAELLWGLKGGGGNFGIATSLEFALGDVGPLVTGGAIFFDGAEAAAVMRYFREWSESLPDDDLTALANLTIAPPVPFIPEEWHGKPVAVVAGCHVGDPDEAQRAFAGLKALDGVIADLIGPIPYTALQAMLDPLWERGARNHMRSAFLTGLTDTAIDAMLAAHATQPGELAEIHVHQFSGAAGRVTSDATAFGERAAPYILNVIGRWSDPAADTAMREWSSELLAALSGVLTGRTYVNFAGDPGTAAEDLYDTERLVRLRALKDRYDPENVFHLNQNITPNAAVAR